MALLYLIIGERQMRVFVDHRNGLPAIACGLPCRSKMSSKPGLLIRPCHVVRTPFSTALVAGWVHRCSSTEDRKRKRYRSTSQSGTQNAFPRTYTMPRNISRQGKLDENKTKEPSDLIFFDPNCPQLRLVGTAQRHKAASFTGNIRNKCSIDAKSIKLPTK